MAEQFNAKGKTFIITGGASGLGALYTERFLKEGAKRIAILDVAVEKGNEFAAVMNTDYPEKVVFYHCDVGDETQLSDVFDKVVQHFERVDVIINNAGIMVDSPTVWRKACDVNWQGLVSLTLKGVKHMRQDEGGAGGTIVNVSSTGAFARLPFIPIYCGSKAAVLHFSQSIAMDPFHSATGVRILIFCLAATKTNLLENVEERTWDLKEGKNLKEFFDTAVVPQKPDSAADAMLKMFKEGVNGSIWLSTADAPARDISSQIDAVYKTMEDVILLNK